MAGAAWPRDAAAVALMLRCRPCHLHRHTCPLTMAAALMSPSTCCTATLPPAARHGPPTAARGLYFDMWRMQRAAEEAQHRLEEHLAAEEAQHRLGTPGQRGGAPGQHGGMGRQAQQPGHSSEASGLGGSGGSSSEEEGPPPAVRAASGVE